MSNPARKVGGVDCDLLALLFVEFADNLFL